MANYRNIPRDNFSEKIININRVAKVVAGGRRFGFSALVAVGDKNGKVGIGHGKAKEIPEAIRKAIERAKKSLITVHLRNNTIKFPIESTFGGGKILLKPASPGTGLIAGGAARAILELAGVKDVLSKSLRSNNPYNLAYATMKALKEIQIQVEAAIARGKIKVKEVKDTAKSSNRPSGLLEVPNTKKEPAKVERFKPIAKPEKQEKIVDVGTGHRPVQSIDTISETSPEKILEEGMVVAPIPETDTATKVEVEPIKLIEENLKQVDVKEKEEDANE